MLKNLLSLTCGLFLVASVAADEAEGPAPDFALAAKDGGQVSLSEIGRAHV